MSNDRFPIEVYSWTIVNENEFTKEADKSVFEHSGTAIPVSIRRFWDIEHLSVDETLEIQLIYNNEKYNAKLEHGKNERTRLLWFSDYDDGL